MPTSAPSTRRNGNARFVATRDPGRAPIQQVTVVARNQGNNIHPCKVALNEQSLVRVIVSCVAHMGEGVRMQSSRTGGYEMACRFAGSIVT